MGSLYDKVKIGLGTSTPSGTLYERAQMIANDVQMPEVEAPQIETQPEQKTGNFVTNAISNIGALFKGEFSFKDVAKEIPGNIAEGADAFATIFAPSITNFAKTTGSIFGEGLAYAIDPNVREQYKAGGLDLLPTISATTPTKLAKATIAAGIETAVFKSFPNMVKMKLGPRAGAGVLQGLGFGLATGLAEDKTAEEIIADLPLYGVSGGVLSVIAPYLIPILGAELKSVPAEVRGMFKGLQNELIPRKPVKIGVSGTDEATRIPISTPNTRYEEYLRSQGYEPYVSNEALPTIEAGKIPKSNVPTIQIEEPAMRAPKGTKIVPIKNETQPKDVEWYRGIDDINKSPDSGDTFFSKSQDVAGDYGRVKKILPDEIPKNPLTIGDKEELAAKMGYDGDPFVEPKGTPIAERFDTRAKEYAQKNGYDAIIYNEGSLGEPELHNFAKEKNIPKEPVIDITPDGPKIDRTTKVPREELPVGTGEEKVSKLEARVKSVLDDANPQAADDAGIQTYQQMNKKEQIASAVKFVQKDPEAALAVLKGEKNPPEGLLHNSIAIALEQHAASAADANLAIKLASLRSTRMGQEISILTEADPSNPISAINEIIEARIGRAARTTKSTEPKRIAKEQATIATKEVSTKRMQIAEAENLLKELSC